MLVNGVAVAFMIMSAVSLAFPLTRIYGEVKRDMLIKDTSSSHATAAHSLAILIQGSEIVNRALPLLNPYPNSIYGDTLLRM